MDGLPGLEKVFREEFPKERYKGVRFMSHVTFWLSSAKLKQKVADDIRSIFYASSREKAMEFSCQFTSVGVKMFPPRWNAYKIPWTAVWPSSIFQRRMDILRTTNVIERLNKEFRRRPNRWRSLPRKCLLYTVIFYQHQDGNVLAIEPCRESALQSPSLRNLLEGNFTQSPWLYREIQSVRNNPVNASPFYTVY